MFVAQVIGILFAIVWMFGVSRMINRHEQAIAVCVIALADMMEKQNVLPSDKT